MVLLVLLGSTGAPGLYYSATGTPGLYYSTTITTSATIVLLLLLALLVLLVLLGSKSLAAFGRSRSGPGSFFQDAWTWTTRGRGPGRGF